MFELTLLHPKIIHFTIALYLMGVFLDWLGMLRKSESILQAAWYNYLGAGVFAVLSVASGLLAAGKVAHNDAAHEIMETHELIGYMVLGIILVVILWRFFLKGAFPKKFMALYLAIGLIGSGLLVTGAYLGGEMVYTHGVAVKAVPVMPHEHGEGHHHEGAKNAPKIDSHEGHKLHPEPPPVEHHHPENAPHIHNHE
ncbi:MAG: hypothetical protein Kow0037_28610 [Calditrichia bacterium]